MGDKCLHVVYFPCKIYKVLFVDKDLSLLIDEKMLYILLFLCTQHTHACRDMEVILEEYF